MNQTEYPNCSRDRRESRDKKLFQNEKVNLLQPTHFKLFTIYKLKSLYFMKW